MRVMCQIKSHHQHFPEFFVTLSHDNLLVQVAIYYFFLR